MHDHEGINRNLVSAIVFEDLPELVDETERILRELDSDSGQAGTEDHDQIPKLGSDA